MSVPSESTELEVLISNPIGEAPDKERKVPDEDESSRIMRFVPFYGEDTIEAHRRFKESAWQHILSLTSGGDDEDETLERYLRSINPFVGELRNMAYYEFTDSRRKRELMLMMVRDGCCFLQLALHILGAGELLGYPSSNAYFGKYGNSRTWIPSMFFTGNQIPYVVIDALMNQDFFKDVIRRGKWRRPSDGDVVKLALYETVVEPQLTTEAGKKVADSRPRDFSVVTALRNALLGSYTNDVPSGAVMRRWWYRDLEDGMHKDDNRVHFPSATELKRSGVKLRKAKGGIASIQFKNRGYSASLYLPPFHIVHYMSILLTSVVQLEKSLPETEREVTSYVSLMWVLTPTYKDFDILKDQGILIFPAHNLEDAVDSILNLNRIVPHSDSYLTPNLRDILRGIKEYELYVPWQRMSFTCSIVCGIITFFLAVFTIVQTVFTVLSYYYTINPRPPN